jgi:hypothetical protein
MRDIHAPYSSRLLALFVNLYTSFHVFVVMRALTLSLSLIIFSPYLNFNFFAPSLPPSNAFLRTIAPQVGQLTLGRSLNMLRH